MIWAITSNSCRDQAKVRAPDGSHGLIVPTGGRWGHTHTHTHPASFLKVDQTTLQEGKERWTLLRSTNGGGSTRENDEGGMNLADSGFSRHLTSAKSGRAVSNMVKSVRKVPKYGIVPCMAPCEDKHSIHTTAQHTCPQPDKQRVIAPKTPPHCSFFISPSWPHHLFLEL